MRLITPPVMLGTVDVSLPVVPFFFFISAAGIYVLNGGTKPRQMFWGQSCFIIKMTQTIYKYQYLQDYLRIWSYSMLWNQSRSRTLVKLRKSHAENKVFSIWVSIFIIDFLLIHIFPIYWEFWGISKCIFFPCSNWKCGGKEVDEFQPNVCLWECKKEGPNLTILHFANLCSRCFRRQF